MVDYSKWDNFSDSDEEEVEQHSAAPRSEGLMFLRQAAETGDCEGLARVLSAGGVDDINELVPGSNRVAEPALQAAVRNNHHDAAKLLLDRDAGPDIANSGGSTALQIAVAGGQARLVRLLLDRQADPNLVDNSGQAPILFAAEYDKFDCAELLLNRNADPNAAYSNGRTALGRGAELGHVQIVRLLLDRQADPNLADQDGRAPVHRAAFCGKLDCVKLLVEAGCDTTQQWKKATWDEAVDGDQLAVQDFLRESGDPAYVLAEADTANDEGDRTLRGLKDSEDSDYLKGMLAPHAHWRRALAGYKAVVDRPRAREMEGRVLFKLGSGLLRTQITPFVTEQQFRQEQLGDATGLLEQAVPLLAETELARLAAAWLLTAKFMSSWQSAKNHIDSEKHHRRV